jgi:hypothetical protein
MRGGWKPPPEGREVDQSQQVNYFKGMVEQANATAKILRNKPQELKIGYTLCAGGILNAYREGDLNFEEAVVELEKWKEGRK